MIKWVSTGAKVLALYLAQALLACLDHRYSTVRQSYVTDGD